MKLKDWIDQFPRDARYAERDRIGRCLDVSEITVRSYANGNRPVPAEQLIPLMDATEGQVTPDDMRPDLTRLYSYKRRGVAA